MGSWLLAICIGWLNIDTQAAAQPEACPAEPPHGDSRQIDFGMVFKAQGGGFKNLVGVVTVPTDWTGQQRVRVVKEDVTAGAVMSYRAIDDMGRQMVVKVPFLPAGQEVRAVVTFEVEMLPPAPGGRADPASFQSPTTKTAGRKVSEHLAPSPKIESNDPAVRQAAQQAIGERSGAWEKVEAIHRWVRKNIEYSGDMANVQNCATTLETHRGVCAEINSLAVAMLRAAGFPARLVRIPGHCYYEVYLLDGAGKGHWLAGDASRDATIVPDKAPPGIILQKGDNVSVIDPHTKRRTKGRFLAETATGLAQSASARLEFQPISPAIKAPAAP